MKPHETTESCHDAQEEMGIVPGGGSVLLYLGGRKFIETVQKAHGGQELADDWDGFNSWDYYVRQVEGNDIM